MTVLAAVSPDGRPGWRAKARRAAIGVAALVALLGVAGTLFGGQPTPGPRGSSFTSTGGGVAALAELAETFEHPVVRYTRPLTEIGPFSGHGIAPDSTLVILNASLDDLAVASVERFVRDGGTLVAGVRSADDWLADLALPTGQVRRYVGEANIVVARAEVVQSRALPAASDGPVAGLSLRILGDSFFGEDPFVSGDATVIARSHSGPIAVRVALGDGQVVALADSSMLTNDLLDQADNAAFALDILTGVSAPDGDVVFAEEPHGYSSRVDATGLPSGVRWFLGGLVVAVLVLMWSQSRRNGPPEAAVRELAPARSLYLSSMADGIDRMNRRRFPRGLRRSESRRSPHIPAVPVDADTFPAVPVEAVTVEFPETPRTPPTNETSGHA